MGLRQLARYPKQSQPGKRLRLMQGDPHGKTGGNKPQQSLWEKIFGTNGIVGLFVAVVGLATFLYTAHIWPFSVHPDGSEANSGSQGTRPRQASPGSTGTRSGQVSPKTPGTGSPSRATAQLQFSAQLAVRKAVLTPGNLGSTFGNMQPIPSLPDNHDPNCKPTRHLSAIATAQQLFGTDGVGDYQARQANDTSYSNVYEGVAAYNGQEISALSRYLSQYKMVRDACADHYQGSTSSYHLMPKAPRLCSQSFVMMDYINDPITELGYEAFIRCGTLLAYVLVLPGKSATISQNALFAFFMTAAKKLQQAESA